MGEETGGGHRSNVIERAVNVEWLMSALISQHYLERVDTNLLFQVLYDECFSFALKRRIVEKILDMTSQQVQSLNRLNTIRNYFAHCSQQVAKVGARDDLFVPDPRQPDKSVDFEALYNEFMGLLPGVETLLLEAFHARGGAVLDAMPRGAAQQPDQADSQQRRSCHQVSSHSKVTRGASGARPMTIVDELLELGFRPGLRMQYSNGRYAISAEEAFNQPPPLVYVLVDRVGESVRTGRSLKQTIRQREGATEAGLNGLSTDGQNSKPVILGLRSEILQNGPLVSYIKRCTSEEAAKREEVGLYDRFRGRLDKRRG